MFYVVTYVLLRLFQTVKNTNRGRYGYVPIMRTTVLTSVCELVRMCTTSVLLSMVVRVCALGVRLIQ